MVMRSKMTYLLFFFIAVVQQYGLVLSEQFNCPPLPPLTKPAQSVHDLRPQDIKVVMALGDSVTAGLLLILN